MSVVSKVLPLPLHSVTLLIVWLALNASIGLGHILLGTALGIIIPLLCKPLRMPEAPVKRPLKVLSYIAIVAKDILVANVQVALLVVGPMRNIKPGFVAVPLDLPNIFPITVLASTVTMTPGTVSCEISSDKKWLYVHVLNMPDDEQEIIDFIKQRYEARIKEIFAC